MDKLTSNIPNLNDQEVDKVGGINDIKTQGQVSNILDENILSEIIESMENSGSKSLKYLAKSVKETGRLDVECSQGTILIQAVTDGCEKVVEMLLRVKDNGLNTQGNMGMTALIFALDDKNTKIAEMLLSRPDLDLDITDDMGETATIHAQDAGLEEIVELIKKHPSFK